MNKQQLYNIIEEKAPLLTALSDKIWEYAEISMLEYKSAAEYCRILKEQGFEVAESICNVPTAFSGRPVTQMPSSSSSEKSPAPQQYTSPQSTSAA